MLSQEFNVLLIGVFAILHLNGGVTGYKNFEMAIFQKIAQNTPSNVIISPYSQKILLGMILEGAVNETAHEIQTALRVSSIDEVHPTASSEGLKIDNRIFLDKAYEIKDDYRKKLRKDYSADVESVEKEKPKETAETINHWVNDSTSGLIPSIIQESDITPDFLMALGNAIHFKGIWVNEFEKELTKKECFYKDGKDDCVMQEMMGISDDERFQYGDFKDLDAEIVNLPYTDGKHSMVIILPKQRNGIGQLLGNIHDYSMHDLTTNLNFKKINLKIPKFTAEYKTDTIEVLKSLNITRVFSPGAQLSNMVDVGPVQVSQILHKSKILVYEKGSEAAAVSLAKISLESLRIDPEVSIPFIADHPFLYFIKDDLNNVLFAGKYIGS